jgi:hypothetical protein
LSCTSPPLPLSVSSPKSKLANLDYDSSISGFELGPCRHHRSELAVDRHSLNRNSPTSIRTPIFRICIGSPSRSSIGLAVDRNSLDQNSLTSIRNPIFSKCHAMFFVNSVYMSNK